MAWAKFFPNTFVIEPKIFCRMKKNIVERDKLARRHVRGHSNNTLNFFCLCWLPHAILFFSYKKSTKQSTNYYRTTYYRCYYYQKWFYRIYIIIDKVSFVNCYRKLSKKNFFTPFFTRGGAGGGSPLIYLKVSNVQKLPWAGVQGAVTPWCN